MLPFLPGPNPGPSPSPIPVPLLFPTPPPSPGPFEGVVDLERGSPYEVNERFFHSAASISIPASGKVRGRRAMVVGMGAGIIDGIGGLPCDGGVRLRSPPP